MSVKVKDRCGENFQWQSFQLKKSKNNQRNLDKSSRYHMELLQNNILYTGSDRCLPVNAVMKG